VVAVTSFSPDGFDLYGRDFLKSFLQHTDLSIRVYLEEPPGKKYPKNKRIEYRSLIEVQGFAEFMALAPASLSKGYRWNANKFGRKVFAQLDTFPQPFGPVYWFDADVVFQKKLDSRLLKRWIDEVAVAYLGRTDFHLCSSFVGYNMNHPHIDTYIARMTGLYIGGKLFDIKAGWTDCDAMEAAMEGLATRNICAGNPKATGAANVFDMYLPGHHKKGNRKYK
jgi:hypothetical protein